MKRNYHKFLTYLGFGYHFIGPISMLSYLPVNFEVFRQVKFSSLIFVFLSLILFLHIILINGIIDGIALIRFFWGFLLFYILFYKNTDLIDLEKIILFLCSISIAEVILINFFIPAYYLPNFPDQSQITYFAEAGSYQRPVGFASNSSISSIILLSMLSILNLNPIKKIFVIFTIVLFASVTSIFGLILYFLINLKLKSIIFSFILFLTFFYSLNNVAQIEFLISKVSNDYINLLIDYKLFLFRENFPYGNIFMGMPLNEAYQRGYGGDFVLMSFFQFNGVLGIVLTGLFISWNLNKENWKPIFLMMISLLHYGSVYSLAGQIIFGYFLNLREKPVKEF